MGGRQTIVAVVLAFAGVIAALMLYRGEPGDAGKTLVTLPGSREIPVDAVDLITVQRAGEPVMRFERSGHGWMQIEPLQFPMDPFSVRQLVIQATEVEVVRVLEHDEAATTDLGLDEPRAVVTWSWPDGSYTLAFGRRSVAGRSYVRRKGDADVYVITGELYDRAVEMNPLEWRDRTIFSPTPTDVTGIEVDDGEGRVVIQKRRKRWVMTEPVNTRADALAVEALLSAILRAKSAGFILDRPADLSRFGLADPSGTLTIRSHRQVAQGDQVLTVAESDRLLVGSRTGVGSEDRFAMVEGRETIVRLPAAVIAAFFPKTLHLVDPTPSGVLPADVKAIMIRNGDAELRLQRDLERWTAPDIGADADPVLVEAMLNLLTETRAEEVEIVDLPLYTSAGRTITFYGFDGMPMETVRFGVELPSGNPGFAMDNGDNVWRILPQDTVIPLAPKDFGIGVSEAARASD